MKKQTVCILLRTPTHSIFGGGGLPPHLFVFKYFDGCRRDAITCMRVCCADHEVIKEAAGSSILFLLCRSLPQTHPLPIERGACLLRLLLLFSSADK